MKQKLLVSYLILGLIGFVVSLYLTIQHFTLTKGACDVNQTISCSLVNSSIYSEIFGVPVAVFGLLWFAALFVLAWSAYKRNDKSAEKRLLYWNIAGLVFVLYLIFAEILLKKICPLCTVVHGVVLVTLILSIYSYKKSLNE